MAGLGLVVVAAAGAAWYFFHPKPAPEKQPSQVAVIPPPKAPAPIAEPAAPGPTLPAAATPAVPRPKTARVAPAARTPAPAAVPTNPQGAQILSLQNLAREAYAKGNYAEPPEASAIALSQRVLAMDPTNDYTKKLLETSVNGGKYQVQQAIARKDFGAAHRLADEMAQLLPGRSDVAGLKEDIASAERAEEAARRAAAAAAPTVRIRVFHMHTDKSPADKGPYCLGNLSVTGLRMKFTPESASDGQLHNLEFACSEIREMKKNARVASHQGGFHVRTHAANFNFVPEDPSSTPVPALEAGCAPKR